MYLAQAKNAENRDNKAIIEEAYELCIELIEFAASSAWSDIYVLADIPPIHSQSWLNEDWLREHLDEHLIEVIRRTPAVLGELGAIAPKEAIIPYADEDAAVESLWDLLVELKEFYRKIPRRNEAVGWCSAVESWAEIRKCDPTSFGEVISGDKLATYIEERTRESDYRRVESLEDMLLNSNSAVEWLNKFYRFLVDNGFDNVIRSRRIVLNQAGYLDELSNLHRDNDIDDELKDIADNLDLNLRTRLRDNRLTSLSDETGKGDLENRDIVREISEKLKELVDQNDLNDSFAEASTRLFAWLVTEQKLGYLSDFPAFSNGNDAEDRGVIYLRNISKDDGEMPLSPVKTWSEDLQVYSGLFPQRYILSDDFFDAVPNPKSWQILADRGIVRTDVMITYTKRIDFQRFLPDEPLTDGEHRTDASVHIRDIVFLTKDRIGIMERVRDSQTRARLFLRFLIKWLPTNDSEALELAEAVCECGQTHPYYPAVWLVPVVRNSWIPLRNNIRAQATASSLAVLLRDIGLPENFIVEDPAVAKFLKAIDVTPFDLIREFFADNEEDRTALDSALMDFMISTGRDLDLVRDITEDLKDDSNLLDHLAERRERRRIVRDNQRLGERVEILVKKSLENEGFTVRRTGVGSDFKIKYNPIETDDLLRLELARSGRSWLVEVKATRDHDVRMTDTQVKTAVEYGNAFLLCVVPVEFEIDDLELSDVRINMRFVQNIGSDLIELNDEIEFFKDAQEDIAAKEHSGIQLEVVSGTVRARVTRAVWQDNGFALEHLTERLI